MDARKVLETLLPAIEAIHNGCGLCITEFLSDANEDLSAAGVPFYFDEVGAAPIKVRVADGPAPFSDVTKPQPRACRKS